MNLQVIISGDGWVLDRHGKLLADAFGGELRTEPQPMPEDGVTYLMNYAQIRKHRHNGRNTAGVALDEMGHIVSMLTHAEPALEGYWNLACMMSDALVPMSETTRNSIDPTDRDKATTIPLPVPDYITKRRPRIGIAGIRNAANEHRKGWDLVDRLRAAHPEWDIVTTGGNLTEPEMLAWYRSLDVYLCASRYEGGPMGVIEAYAMNVPLVIPLGVGWCDCALGYGYIAGDYADMDATVECALRPIMGSAEGVAQYIEAHRKLFDSLGV